MKKIFFGLLFTVPVYSYSQTGIYEPLGGGMTPSGTVFSITLDSANNELYVAGAFTSIGGLPIKHYAKWDGSTWDSIPEIASVYFGKFQYVGGELYAYYYDKLWKKISNVWTLIGTTNNQAISCLVEYNGKLIVMGAFDTINGIPLNCFAQYDGVNFTPFSNYMTWPPTGRDFWSAVVYNNDLYVGGNHVDASGNIKRLMKWDGSQWVQLGTGISGGSASVRKLTVYNNKLFVGGSFLASDGNLSNSIFSYNGSTYDPLGGGLLNGVSDMEVHNGELFIVGPCRTYSGREFSGFITFNGTDFCFYDSVDCGGSPLGTFAKLGFYNDSLIVGNPKIAYNGDTINYIGKYLGDYISEGCEMVTTEINELNTNSALDFNLYPNPTNSSITLEFETDSEKASFSIMNYSGQIVMENENLKTTKGKNEFKIDLNELSNGIYLIQVITETTSTTKKIIKN